MSAQYPTDPNGYSWAFVATTWRESTMNRIREISWWYWLVTGLFLAGALSGCPLGFTPAIGLTVVQTLHYLMKEGAVKAFPVQVRIGYLAWMLAGLWGPLGFLHWIQLVGTAAAVLVDYCPMARMLSLLPWNRRSPLSLRLLLETFLHPPVRGNILDAVVGGNAGQRTLGLVRSRSVG
jgi:hypothetical protein